MTKNFIVASILLASCVISTRWVPAGEKWKRPSRDPHDDVSSATIADAAMRLLDLNGDGRVDPSEASVAIEHAAHWQGGDKQVSHRELARYVRQSSAMERREAESLLRRHDKNRDRRLSKSEINSADNAFLIDVDRDGDKRASVDEIALSLRYGGLWSASDTHSINEEMRIWMRDDADGDGKLCRSEVSLEDWQSIEMADADHDGLVDANELEVDLRGNFCETSFTVDGNVATMVGTIGPSTPAGVLDLIVNHPFVDTIVMRYVPGSIDQHANRIASELIHRHRFTAIIPRQGLIASGATDFFLAATQRIAHVDARIGVHAWADIDGSATRNREAEEHQAYLSSFAELDIPADFYWFTLDAAPGDGMHWMTESERRRFGIDSPPKR
ncbi:EF hand [Rubripirellula tenax]|uniref:EF hand n=1 Tax=Rubripirellula tenax TaxID=2528015 RepID=A0A5C6F962_9BACT|nr:hypothetical protein [Rubripirellula tenax]TWU56967.1 EF hand [Rubripirellula tenax]